MGYKISINRMALNGKLPQGDSRWKQFNDGFDNLTLSPTEIAEQIYFGYSFTTWHSGRRSLANFILGQHIAVDMDTCDERSTLETLEQHPWVRMYAGILYTTPSHTEQSPRARIVFLLDQPITDATAYGEAVQFVMSQFDNPDTSCKDASRFFYGSKNCDLLILDNHLPVSHLRRLYAKQRKTAMHRRPVEKVISMDAERMKRWAAATETEDDKRNKPKDMDEAITALNKIPPYGVDYNTWIGIIKAMRDEFGDKAFSAVERWAQGTPGEVQGIWERRRESGKQASLGTIFYLSAGGR